MRNYFCCQDGRRSAVLAHGTLNGIDFIEVHDDRSDPPSVRQRTLFVHFLKPLQPGALSAESFRVDGGERITGIDVVNVSHGTASSPPASPPASSPPSAALAPNVAAVEVSAAGDYSVYTLRVVGSAQVETVPAWLDPVLSSVDFSFKVLCDTEFDCEESAPCPVEEASSPEINYLAKDYGTFRQLLLDRLAALIPDWTERNPADVGIALIELLAYVGDRLSYEQDARHTEAYLATARKRNSVRRMARLVDYFVHDGANARTWARVIVRHDVTGLLLRATVNGVRTALLTRIGGTGPLLEHGGPAYEQAMLARPEVFELMRDVILEAAHNRLRLYDWGDEECCLPAGAVKATLRGHFPRLQAGAVLILAERLGPTTGDKADADPTRRHAVRLTRVTTSRDPLGGRFDDPPTDQPVDVTEVEWSALDALPFPLCLTVRTESGLLRDASIAWGNVVAVDHGWTVDEHEALPRVPAPDPSLERRADGDDRCGAREPESTSVRYRPWLARGPVSQVSPYDPGASATEAMRTDPERASPALELVEQDTLLRWTAFRDLLGSEPDDLHFVAEVESDGSTRLRFGDGVTGARPRTHSVLQAEYRVGNGPAGNIGAESLAHLVSADPVIVTELGDDRVVIEATNPMTGVGGVAPETIEEVRRNAPYAFRVQERAVTEADYADAALRVGEDLQRAAASFRWTGSWYTVFVTADRFGGRRVDPGFEQDLRSRLERFRMAGHDLEVDEPQPVSLEIELNVCLEPGYFKSDVERELRELFSNRVLPDGRRGLFHPDRLTFEQPVYLSPLHAAAQALDGVASVRAVTFQRQSQPETSGLDDGRLEMERLEIPRLDTDPNYPERGVFRVHVVEAS